MRAKPTPRLCYRVGTLLVTLPAAAGPAAISDTLTFFQNGGPFNSFSFIEPRGDGQLTELMTLNGVSFTGDAAQFGNYTVLTEPDGTISDVFGSSPRSGTSPRSGSPGSSTRSISHSSLILKED